MMNKNRELYCNYLNEEGIAYRDKLNEILNKPEFIKRMTTGVVKKYKKGEIIYSENSPTERLYFLKEGRVFLKCFDVDGNEFIYNLVPKNEYFGLSSIINAYAVSSAQAAADCEIYSIETKQLNELLIQYPEICLTAFKYVVRKFRNNEIRLKNISARNSKKLFSNHIISIMREKGICLIMIQ
jgi:CRP-like cAMP-binding protein